MRSLAPLTHASFKNQLYCKLCYYSNPGKRYELPDSHDANATKMTGLVYIEPGESVGRGE